MKVVVINGSPKGKMSITYHHVLFIEKHFKDCDFDFIHIGLLYKKLNQESYIESVIKSIKDADCVMFIYPVYTFSIPYQLMLFMEELYKYKGAFDNIYAFQLSTSKHFYDITAYDYMQIVLEDLGFIHLKGHMADMNDLLDDQGRKKLVSSFSSGIHTIKNKRRLQKKYHLIERSTFDYHHHMQGTKEKKPGQVLIIYNGKDYTATLKNMIDAFENYCSYQVHRLDFSNIENMGGCIGCIKCAFTAHCVYKDDFETMHRNRISTADVLIYASDIRHHWMHSDFKYLHDRAFYNGHRMEMKGKAIGYLLTGSLAGEPLNQVIEARAGVGHMHLLGMVTNEEEYIDDYLKNLASDLDYYMENRPITGDNFYGVGGSKIFRDLVYEMRGIMIHDHRYYKKEKLYDFPKKAFIKNFFLSLSIRLMNHPKWNGKYINRLNETILKRYKDAIEEH